MPTSSLSQAFRRLPMHKTASANDVELADLRTSGVAGAPAHAGRARTPDGRLQHGMDAAALVVLQQIPAEPMWRALQAGGGALVGDLHRCSGSDSALDRRLSDSRDADLPSALEAPAASPVKESAVQGTNHPGMQQCNGAAPGCSSGADMAPALAPLGRAASALDPLSADTELTGPVDPLRSEQHCQGSSSRVAPLTQPRRRDVLKVAGSEGGRSAADAAAGVLSSGTSNAAYAAAGLESEDSEAGTTVGHGPTKGPPLPASGNAQLDRYLNYLLSEEHPHKFLHYPRWGVSAAGCTALAVFLRRDRRVRVMTLAGNGIGDEGVELLAAALRANRSLHSLDLCDNCCGDVGAVALAEALHHNATLTELQLKDNKIGDVGAEALAAALAFNQSLSKLPVAGNPISSKQQRTVAQALRTRQYKMPPNEQQQPKLTFLQQQQQNAARVFSRHRQTASSLQFSIELIDALDAGTAGVGAAGAQASLPAASTALPPQLAVAALCEASCLLESSLSMLVAQLCATAAAAVADRAARQQQQQQQVGVVGTANKPRADSAAPPAAAAAAPCHEGIPPSAPAADAGNALPTLPLLACQVARQGYVVQLRSAACGAQRDAPDPLRNLRHSFVRVSQPGELTAPVLLDPGFRAHFELARPSERYAAVLGSLPPVLVLLESRAWFLVEVLCAEMAAAYREQGRVLPPWREARSMVARWLPSRCQDVEVDADHGEEEVAQQLQQAEAALAAGGAEQYVASQRGNVL